MLCVYVHVYACICVHADGTKAAVFILVALPLNAFPHLNMTPPIFFICGREIKWYGREERVSERNWGVGTCAHVCEHTLRAMRIGASWWCNLFHHPHPLSPFVLLFLWPMYNKPLATVSYIAIYRHLLQSTIISWPPFHLITFSPPWN